MAAVRLHQKIPVDDIAPIMKPQEVQWLWFIPKDINPTRFVHPGVKAKDNSLARRLVSPSKQNRTQDTWPESTVLFDEPEELSDLFRGIRDVLLKGDSPTGTG